MAGSYLRTVFTLDTLDTRFTTPSSKPYKPDTIAGTTLSSNGVITSSENGNGAAKRDDSQLPPGANPSKWRTREFYWYYVAFLICVPYMLWVPYEVSRASDPRYEKYKVLLIDGWVPGRKMDNSDAQYRTFRNNLPAMAALLLFHPLLRKAYNAIRPLATGKNTTDEAQGRLEQRASFDAGFALVFLAALHGSSAFKVLLILYINFNIGKALPRRYVPTVTWIFNITLLFANDYFSGYSYRTIAAAVFGSSSSPNSVVVPQNLFVSSAEWLDSWEGIMPRWHILFNFTVLRLISFNMDYYWSHGRSDVNIIEKQIDPSSLSERDRVSIPAAAKDFSFRNYLAYAIYAPLYLTGPILTFNDYVAQIRHRPQSIETHRTIRYGVRFLVCLLAMELELHFDYVNAIAIAYPDWSSYSPAQLCLLSYHNLHILWLKLLLPWRLFRLWALIDGIDPPENMIRCPSDNFSVFAFWRAWHRSFNKWLLRYVFIPLGGSDFSTLATSTRSIASYLLVFTFVALWHDIKLRLLIWSWLIVLFLLPEAIAKNLFPTRKLRDHPTTLWVVQSLAAVANVMSMMVANLVGFAVGLDGLLAILGGIFGSVTGVLFFLGAYGALFIGVQIMFEVRESEYRKGIHLRC